ncbi:Threonine/homoserine efflux transporter RhtA [Dehalogenimonas formicexedens]|uniref:Threonine/homoserine efflux transporter RhtA n=1 Tax=Dehalogenimonas formicexedens TaxID=1839801 RepID=A0A1P8F6C6_9CHLR|nr:DMT family transporter [Dehalogenimonas formicexedens]APV43998.1 Threonine/homoserine efflux transporter RhtA [Dehalogenimonas formicexedens]
MFDNLKSSSRLAIGALVAVTAAWGATFIVVQDAVSRMPVMDFLAVRFCLAALVMIAIRPQSLRGMGSPGFKRAAVLGLALGLGYITQTFGLQHASAAVSGFITGMFVVLTPVVSWLVLKRKTGANVWWAVILATIGLAVLSLNGWSIGIGELLTLLCAIFFAFHIVGLGEWSSKHDVYGLAVLQISFVGILSLVAALPGGLTLPPDSGVWGAVVITALVATAFAFVIQTWAQSLVSATRAAVIMTMEPVFAGFFAVVLAGDRLTLRIVIGGALVLAAMLLTELKSKPKPGQMLASSVPNVAGGLEVGNAVSTTEN